MIKQIALTRRTLVTGPSIVQWLVDLTNAGSVGNFGFHNARLYYNPYTIQAEGPDPLVYGTFDATLPASPNPGWIYCIPRGTANPSNTEAGQSEQIGSLGRYLEIPSMNPAFLAVRIVTANNWRVDMATWGSGYADNSLSPLISAANYYASLPDTNPNLGRTYNLLLPFVRIPVNSVLSEAGSGVYTTANSNAYPVVTDNPEPPGFNNTVLWNGLPFNGGIDLSAGANVPAPSDGYWMERGSGVIALHGFGATVTVQPVGLSNDAYKFLSRATDSEALDPRFWDYVAALCAKHSLIMGNGIIEGDVWSQWVGNTL